MGLTHYFLFYNAERLHQSLGYTTPDEVYQTAAGGGAKIVDKFGGARENWDSAIQLYYKQGSILNSVNICLDRRVHFNWRKKRPELFDKSVYNQAGLGFFKLETL